MPDMPTETQFSQYFLYIAYDVINDSFQQQQQQQQQSVGVSVSPSSSSSTQQYKKFVQSNKEETWARDLMDSVNAVTAVRNSYKVRTVPSFVQKLAVKYHE